jgi:hypothetical protein
MSCQAFSLALDRMFRSFAPQGFASLRRSPNYMTFHPIESRDIDPTCGQLGRKALIFEVLVS